MSFPDMNDIYNLLKEIETYYPGNVYYDGNDFETRPLLGKYLAYLADHQLIYLKVDSHLDTDPGQMELAQAKISARGIDYASAHGGLTAQLSPVTIRFEQNELVEAILRRLQTADAPKGVKEKIGQALKDLPAESLKHLLTQLLDQAVYQAPNGIQLLRTLLGL